MKPLDRDLRDALETLAGDPIADARRVLAALPPGPVTPPPPRGLPPAGWWMLGGGLVLGLGAGMLLMRLGVAPAPADQPPAIERQDDKAPVDDKKPEPKKPDQPRTWPMPESEGVLLMAFAPMSIDEPGSGVQQLEPMQYQVADGTTFTTREGTAGLYMMANDVRLRLDAMTEARVEPTSVTFGHGRIWLDCGGRNTDLEVRSALAVATVEGGSCMFAGDDKGMAVIAVSGNVSLRTEQGEATRIEARYQVWIDKDRGMTRIQQVPFLGTATSWMTRMILAEQDDTELRARVKDMVLAYEDGARRAEAEREIRKLGSACVPMLVYGIEQHHGHGEDYARTAAQLLAQLVDYLRADYVLPLLLADDAEVRVETFTGLRRATGLDLGQSEQYWRGADVAQRQAGFDAWKQALGK